ncbi:MAG: CPBP family intramembrane metalloprotease [Candidatus Omnitrophica bacterium]|nr:CPBP family intramembrane metalloprotease [Candidatus Omnitrophota bacterium]
MMATSVTILSGWALYSQQASLNRLFYFKSHHIWIGIFSALFLYGVFWAGRALINIIFMQSGHFIQSIYQTKQNTSPMTISLLLLCIIGPGEEIFWRGYIQHTLTKKTGITSGYFFSVFLYILVHIWSCNPLLLIASGICGLFWGWLFLRTRTLWPGIISHALWDILVFVLFPLAA